MKTTSTYDRLPLLVESPGYRKTTGEFTFTVVTPRKYEDLAKAFMERISRVGVAFFRPCLPEEIDGILESGNGSLPESASPPSSVLPPPSSSADVETLAALLGMTERNVQLQVDSNLLVRAGRGQYDMLASYVALWKAYKELQSGAGDAYNHERVQMMRLNRQKRELDYLERAGKLVNAEKMQRAYENVESEERHAIINMPKTLGPQCDMLPGTDVELRLNDWARRHLAKFSSFDEVLAMARGREKDVAAAGGKGPEKAVSRKARKGRKEGRGKK
jgi:hypothetical protein